MIGIALVAVGAALGATARYALASAWRARFPWSILTANVIGSFLLGILLVRAQDDVYLFLGVGFCGALTTFSTFALDTLLLAREGRTDPRNSSRSQPGTYSITIARCSRD